MGVFPDGLPLLIRQHWYTKVERCSMQVRFTSPSTPHAMALAIGLLGVLSGCAPKDPMRTLENIAGGALRVGSLSAPPWVVGDPASPAGIEARLVRELAHELDAQVEWHHGGPEELFKQLESFQLDILLAGLTDDSPWHGTVAFTRPYLEIEGTDGTECHVWALPPGENGFLLYVERFLTRHRQQARRLIEANP